MGKSAMTIPQWTLAFNFTSIAALFYVKPLTAAPVTDSVVESSRALSDLTLYETVCAPFTGVSQVFVVNNPVTGALILAGISYYSCGCAVGAVLGPGADELASGLWGFNSALTALATSVFFVHNLTTLALSVGGACATAVLFAGLKTAMASAFAVPALTIPFCAVMSGIFFLNRGVPRAVLAASPHSPEINVSVSVQ